MKMFNRTLTAAVIVGAVSSFAGPANAVPLGASLALRDAATPTVETVQWRRWGGRRGFGFGFAAGALVGAAIAAPYYRYGYYGYGYPAYGYYPAYSYGYPAYYGYAGAPGYYYYRSRQPIGGGGGQWYPW